MKELTTYNRAAGYLNTIFNLLNERFFNNELERPVITIQSTPRAYGHYTPYNAWSVKGEKGMREINIGAGTLTRNIENVVSTLLHEMVHYWNDMNGVKDTSRGGTYHNKKFLAKANECGLLITHSDKYGWSHTEPSEEILAFCVEHDLTEIRLCRFDFEALRISGAGTHSGNFPTIGIERKKSSSRKYVCPCCGMSVRATKEVHVMCMDCEEELELAG